MGNGTLPSSAATAAEAVDATSERGVVVAADEQVRQIVRTSATNSVSGSGHEFQKLQFADLSQEPDQARLDVELAGD